MKQRVAILGATGYGGGELLRLLLHHPSVEIVHATSRTEAGKPVASIHRNLDRLTSLKFSSPSAEELRESCDVVFGALPHGASAETLAPLVDAGLRVIDLSGDFRLRDAAAYKKWYHREHPRPDLLATAVYGLPEANRAAIAETRLLASPGCFATAIELALLPAAARLNLRGATVVTAMTGSSGSGAEPGIGTHHPLRAQNLKAYKVLDHQHTPEILQTLAEAGSAPAEFHFTPVSAPLVRGILAVVTADISANADVLSIYQDAYKDCHFVKLLTDREPECAAVAGTNYAEVRVRVSGGRLHAMCALDNLVKGGAGQAIQSFNIMHGLRESTGLVWPGTWP